MATPNSMVDLSTTAASNSPAGSESPTSGNDFLQAIQAILRTTNAKGADIASATTTDIGAATGEFVDVTGTTTITGLGTIAAGIVRTVRFTGALTLTHNATSLILPGSANITTANGDVAMFRSLGSGNWKCVGYLPQVGYARTGANGDITSLTALTNITAAAVTVAADDKVHISDTSDSDKIKTVTAQSIADLAATYPIATDAEAVAFTANKLIDGAKLNTALKGTNQSLVADNGYQKLPGGLILQWVNGASQTAEGSYAVNLPMTFPNAVLSVQVSTKPGTPGTAVDVMYQFASATTSAVTVYRQAMGGGSGGCIPVIFAIGY